MKKYLIGISCVIGLATAFSCKKESDTGNVGPATGDTLSTAAIQVTVDANTVRNDISTHYKGIGITENWEDQAYWKYPVSPASTIKTIHSNLIRVGSDDVFWSEPPYNSPKPRLINYGPNEYFSTQTDLVESDGVHFKSRFLDFDEFIALCRETNSEPDVIVPYNRIYYKSTAGGNINTKEDFLKNAEELVRYANKVKGYSIKFWEIGNESWQPSTGVTAEQYRDDIKLFSQRMKAVDPSIKIMANGNSASWFQTVLAGAAGSIDYFNISYYPTYRYTDYDYYRTNDIHYGADSFVTSALQTLYNSGNSGKIKLIITEFNAAGFGGPWKDTNDLGHALVSFQMGADLLSNPGIYSSTFWNLRWYWQNATTRTWTPDDTNPASVFNAADKEGKLNPNGMSLSVLYSNTFASVVDAASENQLIRSYACYDKNAAKMNVFLLNKDRAYQSVKVNLKNYAPSTGEVWVFKGTGETDTQPSWTKVSDLAVKDYSATLALPATSITMIKFN